MGTGLLQGGEPDVALCLHVLDEFDHGGRPGETARNERMPDGRPQAAMGPGRVKLRPEDIHGARRGLDRHSHVELFHVNVLRPVIQRVIGGQFDQTSAIDVLEQVRDVVASQ